MKSQAQINRSKSLASQRRSLFFARAAIRERRRKQEEWFYGKWKELPDGTFIRSQYS